MVRILLFSLVFAFGSILEVGAAVLAPSIAVAKPLDSFVCEARPVFKYRADGGAGREVVITPAAALLGGVTVLVEVGSIKEKSSFEALDGGYSTLSVLLPEDVALKSDANVSITIKNGGKTLRKELLVPAMRHWNVYLYNHSHVDIGYTNTHKNVELLHKNNILEGVKLSRATSGYSNGSTYVWNPEVTWPLERLWEGDPLQRDGLVSAIKDGSLAIDANYVNINSSACSDEELFHLFNFSRKMQSLTGKKMDVFQQFDIPGMSWGLLPVMSQLGIKYIMSWPNASDRVGFVHKKIGRQPFWWVSPNGESKVLFFQPGSYANSGSMTKGAETGRPWFGERNAAKVPLVIQTGSANVDFTSQLEQMEKERYGYDFLVLSWTLWDNCPLDADIPAAVKAWNDTYAYPHITIAGGHQIMSMIEAKYGAQLPTVRGEFTESWTDGLGTAARLTALNRNAKERLTQAETVWSMLRGGGEAVSRQEFDEAWRYVMLGSEHTWCFENPSEPYFQDAIWKVKQSYFREASDRSVQMLDDALAPATERSLGGMGPSEGPANGGVAVFNTHSWAHGGLVTLDKTESRLGDRVVDEKGVEVAAQRLSTGQLVFMADSVPALGSRHYRVVKGKSSVVGSCKVDGMVLQNKYLRLEVNPKTGNITQLVQLSSGKNFADVSVNGGLNAFRWLPANVDAPKADTVVGIEVIESGPLVVAIRVTSKAEGCREVVRTVRLADGMAYAEIENVVDKLPLTAKDGIHFGFGFNVPKSTTRFDIPWGVVDVERDMWEQANRNWITMQRWADVSNNTEGVTWCSLDAPLFEYGKMSANIAMGWGGKGPWLESLQNSSTLYSWVMNNHWHTNFPTTQDGPVTFRYRMLPHRGYDVVKSNRFGLEQSQPLLHVATNVNPNLRPLFTIDNAMVCVTILKPTADGGVIVRLRSLSDKTEEVRFDFGAKTPKEFSLCELAEEPSVAISNGVVSVAPKGLTTLKLNYCCLIKI